MPEPYYLHGGVGLRAGSLIAGLLLGAVAISGLLRFGFVTSTASRAPIDGVVNLVPGGLATLSLILLIMGLALFANGFRPSPGKPSKVGLVGTSSAGTPKVRGYGWIPDVPDSRDHRYSLPHPLGLSLPQRVDLRAGCPPVYDQEALQSCTANAIAAAVEFDLIRQHTRRIFIPSRLFLYFNERLMEGTVNYDSGAQIRDGIKSVASQGDCPENLWPYDVSRVLDPPPKACYKSANKYKALEYQRLSNDLSELKGCLASGYPFVFGFHVYPSFESAAATGEVPMPASGETTLGGHAVLAVGYDDSAQRFLVRNSSGPHWGIGGYFTIPYDYLASPDLTIDLWTIRLVS